MWPFPKKDKPECKTEEAEAEEEKDGGNGKDLEYCDSGVYHFNGQQIATGEQARRLHRADTRTQELLADIDEKIAHLQKLRRLLVAKNNRRDDEKERKEG